MALSYEAAIARAKQVTAGDAVTPSPGRFEGNEDRILAEILESLTGDQSNIDEEISPGEEGDVYLHGGYIARIGQFIVLMDEFGFFSYHDHQTDEAATVHFAKELEAAEQIQAIEEGS